MNRFEFVLQTSVAPHQQPLISLAAAFMLAVQQTLIEQADPGQDPAVLILGAYIAFHTHADVNTSKGYHELLAQCAERLQTSPSIQ